MRRLFHFSLGLNTGVPLACNAGHGDILCRAFDATALAIAQPAELREPDAAMASSISNPCGKRKWSDDFPFFLNCGKSARFSKKFFYAAARSLVICCSVCEGELQRKRNSRFHSSSHSFIPKLLVISHQRHVFPVDESKPSSKPCERYRHTDAWRKFVRRLARSGICRLEGVSCLFQFLGKVRINGAAHQFCNCQPCLR